MGVEYLYILPSLSLLYWIVKTLTKKTELLTAQKYAITSMILLCIACVLNAMHLNEHFETNFYLLFIFSLIEALLSPFYYFYITELTRIKGIRKEDYLAFLPALLILAGFLYLAIAIPQDDHENFTKSLIYGTSYEGRADITKAGQLIYIVCYLIPIQMTVTIIWAAISKAKYLKTVGEFFANPHGKSLRDVHQSTFCSFGMLVIVVTLTTLPLSRKVPDFITVILTIMLSINMLRSGKKVCNLQFSASEILKGLNTRQVTQTNDSTDAVDSHTGSDGGDIQPASIVEEEIEEIVNKAESVKHILSKDELMRTQKEKMFLDTNLTLVSLADRLGTNRTYLSQSIHYHFHTNLAGFIKDMRIEYTMKLMDNETPSSINYQDIAGKAGYSSMSSFYRDFASIVGTTPKQYMLSKQ